MFSSKNTEIYSFQIVFFSYSEIFYVSFDLTYPHIWVFVYTLLKACFIDQFSPKNMPRIYFSLLLKKLLLQYVVWNKQEFGT